MIDKRILTDSVTIAKLDSKDDWGKVAYGLEETLSPVKVDRLFKHTGTKSDRSYSKSGAVLLVYPKFCSVEIDSSYLEAKVICESETFTVKNIIPQYHPFTKKILCYEMEMV